MPRLSSQTLPASNALHVPARASVPAAAALQKTINWVFRAGAARLELVKGGELQRLKIAPLASEPCTAWPLRAAN